MIRAYARAAASVLVALGLAGFAGVLGWDASASLYHLVVGLLFAYAGFLRREPLVVRRMVGGLGTLVVAIKAIVVLAGWLLLGHFGHGPVEVTCLVLGVGSILAARYLPDGDEDEAGGGAARGRRGRRT